MNLIKVDIAWIVFKGIWNQKKGHCLKNLLQAYEQKVC